jgi:trigger factor
MDFYQKNPSAVASLRGTVYEEKILNLIKEKGKSNKKEISKSEAEKILKEAHQHDHDHDHDHNHNHDHDHGDEKKDTKKKTDVKTAKEKKSSTKTVKSKPAPKKVSKK